MFEELIIETRQIEIRRLEGKYQTEFDIRGTNGNTEYVRLSETQLKILGDWLDIEELRRRMKVIEKRYAGKEYEGFEECTKARGMKLKIKTQLKQAHAESTWTERSEEKIQLSIEISGAIAVFENEATEELAIMVQMIGAIS